MSTPDTTIAYCRTCGKALSPAEQRLAGGTIYCQDHAPAEPSEPTSWTAPQPRPASTGDSSPGLAFVLGLIPGVGAIYNGQYAKGFVHVLIFGLMISIMSSGAANELEPLFGFMMPVFVMYMAFEAYHTAKRRASGQYVDEFSSIVPLRRTGGFPAAPILLIALGVVFLLNNLDILRLHQVLKYWPVFLIALGVYMLYQRVSSPEGTSSQVSHEVPNEQR
jgi:hypothetical protein